MWTFDNLPLEKLKSKYNFVPNDEWIKTAWKAPVRFNSGGSGAFVSGNGLVMTNHHVARRNLHNISSAKYDYLKNGFYARSLKEEIKIRDLEVNALDSIKDVTEKVLKAVGASLSYEEQNRAKKAAIAKIEKESFEKTSLRSNVIELYHGCKFHLYRYRKYTDVRLVMAPENLLAKFGGEYDNYSYPRYQFDFAFYRIYKNGKPLKSKHFFKWNPKGAIENELVFVSGNPGSTDRLKTISQLEYDRDYYIPALLESLVYFKNVFISYSKLGNEQKRQAKGYLYGIGNYEKRYNGMLNTLLDSKMFATKVYQENEIKKALEKNCKLKKTSSNIWHNLGKLQKKIKSKHNELVYHEVYKKLKILKFSKIIYIANYIVRSGYELKKPNNERYPKFRDSNLDSLKLKLFSPAPIYPELEKFVLTNSFNYLIKKLGRNNAYTKAILQGEKASDLAQKIINNTKIFAPDFRKKLVDGGLKIIAKSQDPAICLARRIYPFYKKNRKWYEDKIKSIERIEASKLANLLFSIYGKNIYPDATFTLRFSYGVPLSYEQNTTMVPFKTSFYGLFARACEFDNKPPFNLAKSLIKKKDKIKGSVPVNFVLTSDTVGGNSGSPVYNKNLEFVGIIFDRNIHGLSRAYLYNEKQARSVAVHTAGITEVLDKVYNMKNLLRELKGAD